MTDNSEVRRFPQPRGEMAVSLAGAAPPEFTSRGEASGVSTFTLKAYKKPGLPRANADCVRVTDVLVSAVGQIRTEVKSCP
jgi:hypothetical protein